MNTQQLEQQLFPLSNLNIKIEDRAVNRVRYCMDCFKHLKGGQRDIGRCEMCNKEII